MEKQLDFTTIYDITSNDDMDAMQQWVQHSKVCVSDQDLSKARDVLAFYGGLSRLDVTHQDPAVQVLARHHEMVRKEYDKIVGIMLWERSEGVQFNPSEHLKPPSASNDNNVPQGD